MPRSLKDAIKDRRTYYGINNESPVLDDEIQHIVEWAVKYVPSAFNSQSTRVVVLFGDNHKRLWEIVKSELKKIVSPDTFAISESKINKSFESGHGTILFYEDQEVVEDLQKSYLLYKDHFQPWSQQTSGMHQFAIWIMLEDVGLGVSLQHYNPLIDVEVAKVWNINPKWKLVAQMPFGTPIAKPFDKDFKPLSERILVYK